MSALPKPQIDDSSSRGTGAKVPGAAPNLDKFGRCPDSPGELLRRQSNYEADSGYAPLYAAWLADLPRLSSGQVCTLFILSVGVLSLGRPDNVKGKKRHAWTRPVTVEYMAEVCRCHVRDVQRQIRDLKDRKVIGVEVMARGTYKFSLLYRDWQSLPDYQPARMVAIDEPEETAADDAETIEAGSEAVRLVKRPLKVNAGRTGRSISVKVGVTSLRWQNAASLPLVYDAVVQKGELVISTRLASDWRDVIKSEDGANSQRHPSREGSEGAAGGVLNIHPRAADVVGVFEPYLAASGGRLLIGDGASVLAASKAMRDMPREYLVHFLTAVGKTPRASRPISGAKVVPAIVGDAYRSWLKESRESRHGRRDVARALPVVAVNTWDVEGSADDAREVLAHPEQFEPGAIAWAKKKLRAK